MMLIIINTKVFPSVYIDKSIKQSVRYGNFLVSCGDDYGIFFDKGCLCVYYNGVYNNIKRGRLDYASYSDLSDVIKRSNVDQFIIKISKQSLEIHKSLHRGKDVFFLDENTSSMISDDFNFIKQHVDTTLDSDFINEYISFGDCASFIYPLRKVKKIPNGCKTVFCNGFVDYSPYVDIEPSEVNFFDNIANVIDDVIKDRCVYLHLSGGLDSKLIFFVLKEIGCNFEVVHHTTGDSESDSEEESVIDFCKNYGVKCHLLKPVLMRNDIIKGCSHPDYVELYEKKYLSKTFDYHEHSRNDSIFLDGQGGDSLFVQNPSWKIAYSLLLKGNCFEAISKLNQLSLLKGTSFLVLLADTMKFILKNNVFKKEANRFYVSKQKIITHPLLKKFRDDHLLSEYIGLLLGEVLLCSGRYGVDNITYSPLLSLDAICSWINYDYSKNFNDNYDRLKIREMAFSRYKYDGFWDIRKKSSVSIMYKIIRDYESDLKAAFKREVIINSLGDEYDDLLLELSCSSRAIFSFNSARLYRILLIHKFIQSFEDKV